VNRQRAVITGLGVVSPIGVGKVAFWSGLKQGAVGIKRISLFDTDGLPCHQAGEVTDFDAERFLGRKGLKYLDRSTQLAAAATALALEDAGLTAPPGARVDIGLVLGTTFGSVESISGFDRQILHEGPRSVNPMAFPRTVINSPAGHVAIRYGLIGLNATISAGSASSLHAIGYAADFIQMARADILLAGGVEELAPASFGGFCAAKLLSGACGGCPELAAPFDANRTGPSLGEGAAVLVVESADHAAARGAVVFGEVLGFASMHAASNTDHDGKATTRAMRRALDAASVDPAAIGCICAGANGSRLGDAIEARSIAAVFGDRTADVPIHSIKSMIGETLGASGAFQVASSIMTVNDGVIPPTMNFVAADEGSRLGGVSARTRTADVAATLINASSDGGVVASMVVGRYTPPGAVEGDAESESRVP
jgi:3-oxoacyl-[acyl-carrier-protein] synthase II